MIRSKNKRADFISRLVNGILLSKKFHVELNEHKEYFNGSTIDGPTLSYEIFRIFADDNFYIKVSLGGSNRVVRKREISLDRKLCNHGHIKDIAEALLKTVIDCLTLEEPHLYFDAHNGNEISKIASEIAMLEFDQVFDDMFNLALSDGLFSSLEFLQNAKGNDKEGAYILAVEKLVLMKQKVEY